MEIYIYSDQGQRFYVGDYPEYAIPNVGTMVYSDGLSARGELVSKVEYHYDTKRVFIRVS